MAMDLSYWVVTNALYKIPHMERLIQTRNRNDYYAAQLEEKEDRWKGV